MSESWDDIIAAMPKAPEPTWKEVLTKAPGKLISQLPEKIGQWWAGIEPGAAEVARAAEQMPASMSSAEMPGGAGLTESDQAALEYNRRAVGAFTNETVKPVAYTLGLLPGGGPIALTALASDVVGAASTNPVEKEIGGVKVPLPNVHNVGNVFALDQILEWAQDSPQFKKDLINDPAGTLGALVPLIAGVKGGTEFAMRRGRVSGETSGRRMQTDQPVDPLTNLPYEADLVTVDPQTGVVRLKTAEESAATAGNAPNPNIPNALAATGITQGQTKAQSDLLTTEDGVTRLKTPEESLVEGPAAVEKPVGQQVAQALLNPTEKLQAAADVAKGVAESAQEIKAGLSPASVSNASRFTAEAMRDNLSEMSRKFDQASMAMEKARQYFDSVPKEDSLSFINAIEKGETATLDTKLQPIAQMMRDALDQRVKEVQSLGTGKLEQVIENYFPHIWKDPHTALDVLRSTFSRRPFEGSKAFEKKRSIPTTEDGLNWRVYDAEGAMVESFKTEAEAKTKAATIPDSRIGQPLEPVNYNPVILTLLKLREMDKYIAAQKTLAELKDKGLAKFYRTGEKIPAEWTKIEDRAADVFYRGDSGELVKAGSYYTNPDAARIINNYLSPGLRQYAAARGLLSVGNIINQYQLGFSAFHLGFTSMDAMVSKVALAVKQGWEGDWGAAGKSLLETPIAAVSTAIKGGKMLAEWNKPGHTSAPTSFLDAIKGDNTLYDYFNKGQGADVGAVMDALSAGGARAKMDMFYQGKANESIMREWGEIWDQAKTGTGLPTAAMKVVPRIFTTIPRLIMEEVVPRQKLGVAASMMKWAMDRNPNMTREQLRSVAAQIWDSVDNRLGQVAYDNLFWNKTLKDSLMISVRSVGWNLGTWRELGGGTMDLAGMVGQAVRKNGQWELNKPEMTHRASYVIALNATLMITGAVTTYLATGEGPQDWRDYFFPRIGGTDINGNPERISLPTYGKEEYQLFRGGVGNLPSNASHIIGAKLHPLLQMAYDLSKNKDYWGTEIRHKDDPILEQTLGVGNYIAKSMVPFSIQGANKMREANEPISKQILPFIGIVPAPRDVNKTEAELLASEINRGKQSLAPRTQEQYDKGQMILRIKRDLQAGSTDSLEYARSTGAISRDTYSNLKAMKGQTPLQQQVHGMSAEEAMRVYLVARPEEKQAIEKMVKTKIQAKIDKGTSDEREKFKQIKANLF